MKRFILLILTAGAIAVIAGCSPHGHNGPMHGHGGMFFGFGAYYMWIITIMIVVLAAVLLLKPVAQNFSTSQERHFPDGKKGYTY